MNVEKLRLMGYQVLESTDSDDIATLYKKFDEGNMYIIQLNKAVAEDNQAGIVYLTKEQIQEIFQMKV